MYHQIICCIDHIMITFVLTQSQLPIMKEANIVPLIPNRNISVIPSPNVYFLTGVLTSKLYPKEETQKNHSLLALAGLGTNYPRLSTGWEQYVHACLFHSWRAVPLLAAENLHNRHICYSSCSAGEAPCVWGLLCHPQLPHLLAPVVHYRESTSWDSEALVEYIRMLYTVSDVNLEERTR